ncbi:MAG: GNAT family N-acetyltransferase [Actinomycetaceae bacterium]|nr:GNAT family N-acetyltransferase [Actinomycetaceae bacterium]MDY6083220.1 GNAT family N-acetyltransferase [Actinomycetaceae bacterium]
MVNFQQLRTEDLRLVKPSLADVASLTAMEQDSAIQEWTTAPSPYTEDDARTFIEDVALAGWRDGTELVWFLKLAKVPEPSAVLGTISLTVTGTSARLGFALAAPARGRGLMVQAVRAVLVYAFDVLKLRTVLWSAEIHDGQPNWASARVAWRTGFTYAGIIRGALTNKGISYDAMVATIASGEPMEPQHAFYGLDPSHPAFADPHDPEALVRQFHHVYGMPISSGKPDAHNERIIMRLRLIAEEFSELIGASLGSHARKEIEEAFLRAVDLDDNTRDVVEIADALGDIVYVVYGMALELGIPMPDVLAEIQASNLSKLGADGLPIYRDDGKVLKGPHYFRPDLRRVLGLGDPQ